MKSQHVQYMKYSPAAKVYIGYPGIALSEPDTEGRIQLMFLHPDRHDNLGGADWRDAVDRAVGVLPEGKQGAQISFYQEVSGLPSVADLDKVAEEQKATEATVPEKPKGKLWGKNAAAK